MLQQLDHLAFLDIYMEFIRVMRKGRRVPAERPPGNVRRLWNLDGTWAERSLGDGQIDFRAIFSKFTQAGFDGWATLEWECCLKDPVQGAREGAAFIRERIIESARHSFASEAGTMPDREINARDLGILSQHNRR